MMINSFKDWLDFLVFDSIKAKIDDKRKEQQIKKRISDYTQRYIQQFESSSLDEEFNLQAVMDCLKANTSDIKSYIFETTADSRNKAKTSLLSKAKSCANTSNGDALNNVETFVNNILSIIYDSYIQSLDNDLLFATSIISDEVSPKLDKIGTEVESIKSAVTQGTPLSLSNDDIERAKRGDNSAIESKLTHMQNIIASVHPVKGYENQVIDGKLISVPVSPEAELNPPIIKAFGTVKVGDKYIDEMDSTVIDYAYRHQLNMEFTVDEAEKYLGDTKDPNQYEAELLVGGTLIATPRPFPDAIPISVYCDDELVIGYLLIRKKEILDDGTLVITNEEQKNSPFKFALKINIESRHSDVSFVPEETITIKNMLAIQKILLNAEMGKKISFKKLETDEVFLELSNPSINENELYHRQLRIKVLESILTIENYFKTTLYLPEQMSIVDCRNIIYCAKLINGEKITTQWSSLELSLTVLESTKSNLKTIPEDLTYLGSITIKIWERDLTLPVAITYKKAKLKDAERMIKIIDLLNVGEKITVTLIPDDETGEAIHQLFEGGNKCPEEKT